MSQIEIRSCKDSNPKVIIKTITLAEKTIELRLCESCSKDPIYN
jgi:hypothetical protein